MRLNKTLSILATLSMAASLMQASVAAHSQEVQSAVQMPGTNKYYAFVSNRTTWLDARATANSMTYNGMNGHLANITSAEENSFVFSLGARGWLGAKVNNAGVFEWVDGPESGQALAYTNFGRGEPNGGFSEPYLEGAVGWNDNGTGELFGFFVEFEPSEEDNETSLQPTKMPGTESYYLFVSKKVNWLEARAQATAMSFNNMKGHLANITSVEENSFVFSLGPRGWLGAKLNDSGDFYWVDGAEAGKNLSYFNFRSGEPNGGSTEPYLEGSVSWNDAAIFHKFGFFVEFQPTVRLESKGSPKIRGVNSVGSTLKSDTGFWGKGTSVKLQWLRDGSPVPGANLSSYRVSPLDSGKTLTLSVLAEKPGYVSATAVTNSVVVPSMAIGVRFRGSFKVDGKAWAEVFPRSSLVDYSYQWLRDGESISGENDREYRFRTQDASKKISVRVCALFIGKEVTCSTKDGETLVEKGSLKLPALSISGKPEVGKPLFAIVGGLSSGTELSFQWHRDGLVIPGAISSRFVPSAVDRGKGLSVEITISSPGYFDASRVSVLRIVK